MVRPPAAIADAIDQFQPNDGNWLELDKLLEELFLGDSPETAMGSLFRVFERFPTDDGAGVFWSILHGLESLPNYEVHLAKSIQSIPSEFSVTMVHRLLNSGIKDIGNIKCITLLLDVAQDQSISEDIRSSARIFYDKHSNSDLKASGL